jgi:hypothetical protein
VWVGWPSPGVAGWFLWTEHRAHLFGFLPYLVLLVWPLMHVFMHRRHVGGSSSSASPDREPGDAAPGDRS